MSITASEQLMYSTIRIECTIENGISTGTGFFFQFLFNEELNSYTPVIVTNKHVVKNSKIGKLTFTLADEGSLPLDGQHHIIELENFEQRWVMHPEHDVDLCAMPIADILRNFDSVKKKVFPCYLSTEIIPNKEQLKNLSAIEEIIMVGYPNGIWDHINNKPIFRKGITATHPKFDYNGKKEMLIDAACFPGSSGSPVFIFNEGLYSTRDGKSYAGNRIFLLGILYAGPHHNVEGNIHVIEAQMSQKYITVSSIPNHLGIVIKAERILELENLFSKM